MLTLKKCCILFCIIGGWKNSNRFSKEVEKLWKVALHSTMYLPIVSFALFNFWPSTFSVENNDDDRHVTGFDFEDREYIGNGKSTLLVLTYLLL